jgi:hypothetical protein
MPREANAIDFWRGFALISIFINHIPGIYYSRLTHANISVSDSADLFVFLAGWSLRYVVGTDDKRTSIWHLLLRLVGRALTLYYVQVMITMVAIAMLAATAMTLDNPLLLEWHNAAAVFHDPVPTHIGLAFLTHQLGYFDILPLYVVLMVMAPVIAVIDRYAPNLVLPLSLTVYFVTLIIPITVPTWPVEGQWFFNPLAWQAIFVLGFVMAKDTGVGGVVRRNIVAIRWVALPIVIFFLLVTWFNWWPDPTKLPQPRLLFIPGKTFATPIRLIQFLALVAVFSVAFPYIRSAVPRLVDLLSMCGRNALAVFCMGSLLSLAGQITRFVYRGDIVVDTVVVIVGVTIMVLTAWLTESRDRTKPRAPAPQPVSSSAS